MYDYNDVLLYSTKNHHKRKNGKITYYMATFCDGMNLIVKKLKRLPKDRAINPPINNQWYVHNLDALEDKFNIGILQSEKNEDGEKIED